MVGVNPAAPCISFGLFQHVGLLQVATDGGRPRAWACRLGAASAARATPGWPMMSRYGYGTVSQARCTMGSAGL